MGGMMLPCFLVTSFSHNHSLSFEPYAINEYRYEKLAKNRPNSPALTAYTSSLEVYAHSIHCIPFQKYTSFSFAIVFNKCFQCIESHLLTVPFKNRRQIKLRNLATCIRTFLSFQLSPQQPQVLRWDNFLILYCFHCRMQKCNWYDQTQWLLCSLLANTGQRTV